MAKVTKAGMDVRVKQIQILLLGGHSRQYVIQFCAAKWKIAERQVDEYIKRATDQIDAINEATAERNLAIVVSNLWGLYRKQLKKSPAQARILLMDIARLRGLDKLDVNLRVDRPLKDLSDDELDKVVKGDV